MSSIEAVFEGGVFRPTLPVSLPEGSRVTVVVLEQPEAKAEDAPAKPAPAKRERSSMLGALKGNMWIAPDFNAPLEEFKDYM